MRQVTIVLTGITPLLLDPMSNATLEQIRTKAAGPDLSKKNPKDIAVTKFYRNTDGVAGIPLCNITACLVEAGRTQKNPKTNKQISTLNDTTLYGLVTDFGSQEIIPFVGCDDSSEEAKTPKWEVDERRGVGKNVNPPVAVAIIRPRIDVWALNLTVNYDETEIPMASLIALFTKAGTSNGICGARPNKGRMPFGRFAVTEWIEESLPAIDATIVIRRDGIALNADETEKKDEAA